jgi:cytochrome c-type biogenesis protein CcmH/NrfG
MTAEQRRAMLAAMIAESPDDPELRYSLAMEYASSSDDAEAARLFEELTRLAPNYPPAYHQAGRTLQRLNRIADAKSILTRGIPIAQKKGDAHAAGEMTELLQSMES